MNWNDKARIAGREPFEIFEMDLDFCENIYGRSPCTALGALENRFLHSKDFANAAWVKTNGSITSNNLNSPLGGSNNADTFIPSAVAGVHEINQLYTEAVTPDATTWSTSFWIKNNGYNFAQIYLRDQSNAVNYARYNLDLTTGVIKEVGGSSAGDNVDIIEVTSGWFHVMITATFPASSNQVRAYVRVVPDFDDLGSSWTPNGTDGIGLFGGQIRKGDNPGLYVETTTTAIVGELEDAKKLCYNAFQSCQDKANYVKQSGGKTFAFVTKSRKFSPNQNKEFFPGLKKISYAATRLDPGNGLGARASVTVTLQDFAFDDSSFTEKYKNVRRIPVNGQNQGTFFGKLKARNPFYIGRPMRIKEAYDDFPFSAQTRTREYIIDSWSGPDANGVVTITGKDILDLSKDSKAQAPIPIDSDVILSADPGAGTTLTFANATIAQKLTTDGTTPIDKYVAIEDEVIELGTISGATWINCVRAQGGSENKPHDIGSTVQPCFSVENESIELVLQKLLENFGDVNTSFITIADWTAEKNAHLPGFNLTAIIADPTGLTALITEITQMSLSDMWWSTLDQQIRWTVESPYQNTDPILLSDSNQLLEKTIKVIDKPQKRVSRVLNYFGIRFVVKDIKKPDNYQKGLFEIQADKESPNEYNQRQLKTIFNRWFPSSKTAETELTVNRINARYSTTPQMLQFQLDARETDKLKTGEVFDIETRLIQDADGTKKRTRFQVVETKPNKSGSIYDYRAFAFFADPLESGPLVISVNTTDFDLFVELGGPSGPVGTIDSPQEIVINGGVTVDATEGNAAFSLGALPDGSFIKITNNGEINGFAGRGAAGGGASYKAFFEEEPPPSCIINANGFPGGQGQPGGDAIDITGASQVVEIDNTNGEIFGGGGGGAGADGNADDDQFSGQSNGGGGGGGGQGSDGTNSGGPGGVGTEQLEQCGNPSLFTAADGVDGSPAGAGAGGAGLGAGSAPTSNGATGGTWGEAGGAVDGQVGGPGGFAVRKNGNTVNITAGNTAAKVKGQVA